jgi:hypothetical protein
VSTGEELGKQYSEAYDYLSPIRATWKEKEQSLLAQANDSVSGKITYAKVTDAALSTLAFERQARVAAQLPTGRIIAASISDEASAKLANVTLNRYIVPNADSQHPFLIKLRLWGVYASVYGSMPMFYDYRVDDRYIGPECWLVDPRSFALQPGHSSVQDADYGFISTLVSDSFLSGVAKRKTTTWDRAGIRDILRQIKENDGKTTAQKTSDADKMSEVEKQRYDQSKINNQIELITKYESGDDGHWITFAPDFDNKIVRDIPNPHKSGRIPIVMRHCFPLLNSIFGLGDYERGMRIQKAKDSFTNLALEGAKNRVFPPLKINQSQVTMSTIKNQANARWLMTDMNAVQPVQYGQQALQEYQAIWGSLQSMLMNQFGTTDTSVNQDNSGNPAFGKTPQALQQLESRQNARDTWDMFMHEQATQELMEGLINLLTVKMEKPINFSLFEEDINQIKEEYKDKGLKVFKGGEQGIMTATKQQLASKMGYTFLIDAGSSVSQNGQEQFKALSETWQITHSDPNIIQAMQQGGYEYDVAEHLKGMFIAAGVNNWDKILKKIQNQGQEQGQQPQQPQMDPAMLQQLMQQQQPQGKSPSEMINYKDAPPDIKAQMEQQAGLQPSATHQTDMQSQMQAHAAIQGAQATTLQQQAPTNPQVPGQPDFNDPDIAAVAQQLMSGVK